ncbi:MAG TPA: MFS transporter [Candidatus Dormibacteraeota bacterium]|nr:MFS transporter [Candidatus Dormibacteraeota bacterium]
MLLLGIGLVPWAWMVSPITADKVGTLIYLGIGTQIAALLPIRWPLGNQYIHDPLLIATGLYAPGAGVAVVAWLALFDGRVPGRDAPWWSLAFNRANAAVDYVLPSLAVTLIPGGEWWTLPARTLAYAPLALLLNYSIQARAFSFINRTPFMSTLSQNIGIRTMASTVVLSFSGGILWLLVQTTVGMVMAPGLFGFLWAIRNQVADVQRQTELKDQTLELAAQALDARDPYTEFHSKSVADLAGRLGERLDLGDRECELLRTAGSLHDLGKIGVRDEILNKPGPLTDDEWEIMRKHPDIGADMIEQHTALKDVAPSVRHHHERWDGTGYPKGLKGDAIPFGARILSVADSFDTITGPRLYRRSLMTPLEGVEDISRRAGRWYDPNVVDALRALHGMEPLDLPDRPEVPRKVTAFRVLRANPGFAQMLAAIGISALGDPLTQVAALISIFAATNHDPLAVAAGFIAQGLGTVVMSGALGGIADRFSRRRLLVSLEVVRAALLIAAPFIVHLSVWLLIPTLFALAAINAIVQPARQAAVGGLVPAGQLGKANAIVAATSWLAGGIGFATAGVVLAVAQQAHIPSPTNVLFIADAGTFAIAALLVLGIRGLGGGTTEIRVTGSLRRVWALDAARPHLVVGTLAAFLIAMSFPALLALAFRLSPGSGGQTYALLEVVLSAGVIAGSLAVARFGAIGSLRTAGLGLLLTGIFSLAMTLYATPAFVAIALFIASIGNPIYLVANQTALMEAANEDNRGSVMATRFSLVQTASIAGTAVGGFVTQYFQYNGPFVAYGVLAIGLILLGMFALAAGRRTISPLLGAEYEATLRAAQPAK